MQWHWQEILTGAAARGFGVQFVAHMVNTFPPPDGKYARWALGGAKWWVGQRQAASNTVKGLDSTIVPTAPDQRGTQVPALITPGGKGAAIVEVLPPTQE